MGRNVEAIEAELAALPGAPPALAAAATSLAEGLDSDTSLAQKSMAAKELRETLDRIRELAPPAQKGDAIDRLRDEVAAKRVAKAEDKSTPSRRRRSAPTARKPA